MGHRDDVFLTYSSKRWRTNVLLKYNHSVYTIIPSERPLEYICPYSHEYNLPLFPWFQTFPRECFIPVLAIMQLENKKIQFWFCCHMLYVRRVHIWSSGCRTCMEGYIHYDTNMAHFNVKTTFNATTDFQQSIVSMFTDFEYCHTYWR